MHVVSCQDTAFYRPRQPWDSPLYRLVEEHYEDFEQVYPDRFQARYGFWRPVIRTAVMDYLSRPEGDGLPSEAAMKRSAMANAFVAALGVLGR